MIEDKFQTDFLKNETFFEDCENLFVT